MIGHVLQRGPSGRRPRSSSRLNMDASELEKRIDEIATTGWICPQPMRWNEIYEKLPNRTRKGGGWNPPLPLILAAWWETSPRQKKERFLQHLAWAERERVLESTIDELSALADEDWYLGE